MDKGRNEFLVKQLFCCIIVAYSSTVLASYGATRTPPPSPCTDSLFFIVSAATPPPKLVRRDTTAPIASTQIRAQEPPKGTERSKTCALYYRNKPQPGPDTGEVPKELDDECKKSFNERLRALKLNNSIVSLAYSPQQKILAAMTGGGIVYTWDLTTEKLRTRWKHNTISSLHHRLTFSSNETELIVTHYDGMKIEVWNPKTATENTEYWKLMSTEVTSRHNQYDFRMGPTGRFMVCHDWYDGDSQIIDLIKNKDIFNSKHAITAITCSVTNNTIAIAQGNTIKLLNYTGEEAIPLEDIITIDHDDKTASSAITSIAFSPASTLLAYGTLTGKVCTWSTLLQKHIRELPRQAGPITHLAFLTSCSKYATEILLHTHSGQGATIWNLSTGELTYQFPNTTASLVLPGCKIALGYDTGTVDTPSLHSHKEYNKHKERDRKVQKGNVSPDKLR